MKTCGICGRKLYPQNITGYCQSTPACRKSHNAVKRGNMKCLGCGRWLKKSAELGYCSLTEECFNAKAILRRRALKREVVDAYGGECACCGEKRLYFLTIDHVNGDGASERRAMAASARGASTTTLHYLLRRLGYPSSYQVLCYNCNCAKGTGDRCPCSYERTGP